eukprot:408943-Lingulodinium_polyedra.AAC.1
MSFAHAGVMQMDTRLLTVVPGFHTRIRAQFMPGGRPHNHPTGGPRSPHGCSAVAARPSLA